MDRIVTMMPIYNGNPGMIDLAVKSVLAQGENVEIVMCNDGSEKEFTKNLRNKYGKNPKITLIENKKNMGLPATDNVIRNHILNNLRSKCKYVAWIAGDDEWRPDKIKMQLEYIKNNPVDICYTDTVMITDDNQAFASPSQDFDFNLLCNVNFINGSSILWDMKVINRLAWNEEFLNVEDWDYHIRCYKEGFTFGHLKEMLTLNRRHTGNISNNREKEAYYHAKVCLAHNLPIEIPAARMMRIGVPSMIRGIMKAWTEAKAK